jgi:hypothetical protein
MSAKASRCRWLRLRLDVSWQVGAVTESVTVTTEAPVLKTDTVEQSMNVSGDRINALPLNFGGGGGVVGGIRAPLTFMVLSPGVAGTGTNARVNGAPANTYRVFVDGQDVTPMTTRPGRGNRRWK